MVQTMREEARDPTTLDEEVLEAETTVVRSTLSDEERIARMASELETGFEALGHIDRAVSFFGSARTPLDHPEYALARDLARRLGEAGFCIITGGGPGTMEAANRGARDAGVHSIGLEIDLPFEAGQNEYLDLRLRFHYFFTRKVMFVRYASAFVVFPGGFGTMDELFEALTLEQTDKVHDFPIILVGSSYWSGLMDWLREHMLREGKISPNDLALIQMTDDVGDVVEIVSAATHRQARRPSG